MRTLRLFLTTVLFLCLTLVLAQSIEWVKHYGTTDVGVNGFRLAIAPDGSIYGTGSMGYGELLDFDGNSSPVQGYQDIIIAKWDSSGTNQWVHTVGGVPLQDDWDAGEFIHYEPVSGRIIVTGTYNSQANFGCGQFSEEDDHRSIFMAAYEPNGICAWVRTIRAAAIYSDYLISDHHGGLYWFGASILSSPQFVGSANITIPSGAFVARYDSDGNLLSARRLVDYGSINGAAWVDSTHWLVSIAAVQGAELLGSDLGISNTSGGVLASIDTSGSVVWHQTYQGSTGEGNGSAGCAVVGQHAIVSGLFGGELVFDDELITGPEAWSTSFLASYSLNGDPEWIRPFWTEGYASASPLWVDAASTVYILGEFTDTTQIGPVSAAPTYGSSSFVARYDTTGNCLSVFYFGPSGGAVGSLALSVDDIVLSAPYSSSVAFGPAILPSTNTVLLAKLDTLTGYTGVGPAFMALHEDLLIRANPNNGLCTVQLPTHLQFTNGLLLSIFDQTGQLVQRVPVTMGNAGVQVDIQAQAKGLYHVELGDGRQRYTGTIVFE